MINIKKYLLVLFVTLISGCADPDAPLSPPKENQWITVEGVAPKYTKPYVSAVYISKDCLKSQWHADMSSYKVPTHHGLRLDVKANPQTGYFQAKLPFNGGGRCKWKINQVFVTVGYTDVRRLVKDATQYPGAEGTGLTVFIKDAATTDNETAALNTLDYSPIIYPVLEMVNKFPKRIFLQGEVAQRFFTLRLTPGAEWRITYKPKLDETKMPKIIIPPGKEPSRVEYPDGRVDLNRDSIDYWKIK
ncbi:MULTISPECIES: hypothetical protein [Photorhabdus]|uniref:hypothetical protein n=1 Tax=Photorhabdus TaxID=29487 RepID=UPI00055AB76E|nr:MULTISPECIES: hypothetical protein [Photorhabdus]NRN30230.1 hypothetical protein [Photorhabdus heterorhabditis subsp. aluminescens]